MTYSPDELRDAHGKWSAGGAALGVTEGAAQNRWLGGAGADTSVDPRVHSVAGDEWNQGTGARLESEYAAARPALDKLVNDAAENGVEIPGHVDPQSWDDISGGTQEQAEEKYIESNYSNEYDNEVSNWQENGNALSDAKGALANDEDWKHEALTDLITERTANNDPRIPYSPDDLAAAVKIEWNGEGKDDPDITIDDSKLQNPDIPGFSKDQLTLPGVEPADPSLSLTKEMREHILTTLNESFNEKAEKEAENATPPDYLGESAKESLQESWGSMGDDEKYQWTKQSTSLLDDGESHGPHAIGEGSGRVEIPATFDPLNETSDEDYTRTQSVARFLSTARAEQVMKDRGIGVAAKGSTDKYPPSAEDIAKVDHNIWEDWKGSSTSMNGKLIQVAAHDELGSRLNTTAKGINPEVVRNYANEEFKDIGGYDAIKAMTRAKWETTQYLLDRANIPTLQTYRGINMPSADEKYTNPEGWHVIDAAQSSTKDYIVKTSDYSSTGEHYPTKEAADAAMKSKVDGLPGKITKITDDHSDNYAKWGVSVGSQPTKYFGTEKEAQDYRKGLPPPPRWEDVPGTDGLHYTKLPDLKVERNGAASTTTDPHVANDWGALNGRVVLRAEVPRTAVLSVPAYGINVHSEHESVVMGTAWHNWDAWHKMAPTFETVPMKGQARSTGVVDVLKEGKAALSDYKAQKEEVVKITKHKP